MKYLLQILLLIALFSTKSGFSQSNDKRLDSFDVLKYHINLNLLDYKNKNISGYTELTINKVSKSVQWINLDLFKLTVDSVINQKSDKLNFVYDGNTLKINIKNELSDTLNLKVFYNGKPKVDKSGFGGLVFSGEYVFNIGIAFDYKPHNFGRGWFPCVDNFLDKALFSFSIKAPKQHKVICNGLLESVDNKDSLSNIWNWKCNQLMPPYLVNFASGIYHFIEKKVPSIYAKTGFVDAILAVYPKDSIKATESFKDLEKIFNLFERRFGAYHFDRIGYVSVPLAGGAMEHSTNISFPSYAFSNNNQEHLIGHELAHHWWGNLVTCSSAEDMWLNEGWAAYCEALVAEELSGKKGYLDYCQQQHFQALQYAHLADSDYRPISPMPESFTYGRHIYIKGATAVKTLRTIMGDSLFFSTCTSFLDSFKFKSISIKDMNVYFNQKSKLDLDNFFNHFIFDKGYTQFMVTDFRTNNNLFEIDIYQALKESKTSLSATPLLFSFYNSKFEKKTFTKQLNTSFQTFTFDKNDIFNGDEIIHFTVNEDISISEAKTSSKALIKGNGKDIPLSKELLRYSVNGFTSTDSALLFVEHFRVPTPYSINTENTILLSPDRYWKVDIINPKQIPFQISISIQYDARTYTHYNTGGFLDLGLFKNTNEDSIHIFYRKDLQSDWVQVKDVTLSRGVKIDNFGTITINNAKSGYYTFGERLNSVSINETIDNNTTGVKIFPNPVLLSEGILNLENLTCQNIILKVILVDMQSRTYELSPIENSNQKPIFQLPKELNRGVYSIQIIKKDGKEVQKLIVK